MREGWYGDQYLVFFEDRAPQLAEAYGVASALPGYSLLGLLGWDDFIVEDAAGARYTIPTVPLLPQYLEPLTIPTPPSLRSDARLGGKIKWYLQPVVFGGDPGQGDNLTWVTLEQHTQLVQWWNQKYREVQAGGAGTLNGRGDR